MKEYYKFIEIENYDNNNTFNEGLFAPNNYNNADIFVAYSYQKYFNPFLNTSNNNYLNHDSNLFGSTYNNESNYGISLFGENKNNINGTTLFGENKNNNNGTSLFGENKNNNNVQIYF